MKTCSNRECKKVYKNTNNNNNNIEKQLDKCNDCVSIPGGFRKNLTKQMIQTRNRVATKWVKDFWERHRENIS